MDSVGLAWTVADWIDGLLDYWMNGRSWRAGDRVEAEESRAGFESVFHKVVLAVNGYCLLSHFHRDKL